MSETSRPLRFAVLHHTGHPSKQDHFDLLFETDAESGENAQALLAFATALDEFPSGAGEGDEIVPLHPHRRRYLSYEGPLSGDRGSVLRDDSGELVFDMSAPEGLKVQLSGQRLNGVFLLKPSSDPHFRFVRVAI